MVLLAPTVAALQTLLEVCPANAGPHDIVYNTMKAVCMLVRPTQSQGREELSFVEELHHLRHVMTADCRDHKDIKKTIQEVNCSWQYAGQKVLICPDEGKNTIDQVILLPNLWMCSLASFLPGLY